MKGILPYLLAALGAGLGAMGRLALSKLTLTLGSTAFPVGTLTVNVVGSFLIGICGAFLVATEGGFRLGPGMQVFLITGVLGGFTTFSAFSLQTLYHLQRGEYALASLNVGASVVLCLAAVAGGFALGQVMRG